MVETILVAAVLCAAGGYLLRRALLALGVGRRRSAAGCGGGCGCSPGR